MGKHLTTTTKEAQGQVFHVKSYDNSVLYYGGLGTSGIDAERNDNKLGFIVKRRTGCVKQLKRSARKN